MSEDYVMPGKRKTKGDKRAKARYMKYKRGGSRRASAISLTGSAEIDKSKKKVKKKKGKKRKKK